MYEHSLDDNAAIEFHDSDVESIRTEGVDLIIEFQPAYVHRSKGVPGTDPGTCWTQRAVMVLPAALVRGAIPRLPCSLADGKVTLLDRFLENVVPLPLSYAGDAALELVFADGSTVQMESKGINIKLIGDTNFLEKFR